MAAIRRRDAATDDGTVCIGILVISLITWGVAILIS